jgi:two-component system heavy metal sensor histidine kinase CusS
MMRSIRGRLLLSVVGAMAVLQVALAALVYEVMQRALRDDFDSVLAGTVRTLSASVEQDGHDVRAEIDAQDLPEFRHATRPDYYEVWQDDGGVLARSSSLNGGDLARPQPASEAGSLTYRRVRLPDGRPGRAATLRFVPRKEDDAAAFGPVRTATVEVARDTASLDAQVGVLTWLLCLGAGGTIGVSFILAALVVRRGLRPLDALAARIAAIRQDDLSARVWVERLPTELAPVVERLNDLLRRLEDAFGRERAFTSDAAHELRTPLAGLQSTIEVALARPRGAEEYREALSECLGIVQHTQALAGHLLALARMDGQQAAVAPESVVVAEALDAAWRPFAGVVARRRLRVGARVAPDLQCTADRALLSMIFSELAANAAEYAEEGGRIDVTAGRAPGGGVIELEFANSGCRLSPEEAAHVFERFWRADAARSQTGVHAGLGLALVRQAVRLLGGSVGAGVAGGTFSVRLWLPFKPPNGAML